MLLVGVVLPIVVGLITKASWSSGTKAWLLAGTSAVTGFFAELSSAGDGFDYRAALVNAFVVFVAGVAAHYGFWKPVGVTEKAQAVLVKD